MKTRLSVFLTFAFGVLAAALAPGLATPAHAGPYSDALSQCLVQTTTEEDRSDLVRWIVASTAQHPDAAEFTTVLPERRAELSSRVATIFERLLTQNCRAQFHDARKNEGEGIVSMSFGIMVQTALQGLIGNPSVSSALAGVDTYLDKQKLAAAMDDAPEAKSD